MSILDDYNSNGEKPKQWAHEICRIWCTTRGKRELKKEATPAGSLKGIFNNSLPLKPIVCVICGTSKLLNNSAVKEESTPKEIKDDSKVSHEHSSDLINVQLLAVQ